MMVKGTHRHVSWNRCIAVVALAFAASSIWGGSTALAATGAVSSFGEGFAGQGGFAINESGNGGVSAGDLYVADPDGNRVAEFSSSGALVRSFGADVGGSGVNVCTDAALCRRGTATGAAGGMIHPRDVAVEQATGNVYVADSGNARIDVFSATGAFEGAFGWRVKLTGAAEELQFCTPASGCQTGSVGGAAGQFDIGGNETGAASVALSPLNGHVLVGDSSENQRIAEFAPTLVTGVVTGAAFVRAYGWGVRTGASEFQICTTSCQHAVGTEAGKGQFPEGAPQDLAVDMAGTVYAISRPGLFSHTKVARVQAFDSEGHALGDFAPTILTYETESGGAPVTIYFDPTSGNLLVKGSCGAVCVGEHRFDTVVFELDPAGHLLETYMSGAGFQDPNLGGLARGPDGRIFLSHNSSIYVLGEVIPPVVSIAPPVTPAGTEAELEGHINPTGVEANYTFEFSTDGEHWQTLASGEVPADNADHTVEASVNGLVGLTTYHVRLNASKAVAGGSATAESTFTTPPSPPVVLSTTGGEVFEDGAVLESTVNPENENTRYQFECVDQASFEAGGYAGAIDVPSEEGPLGAGGVPVEVSQRVGGLAAGVRYRCRVRATNVTGSTTGDEVPFKTLAPAPASLPDGRVYEQATPVDKNGNYAEGWTYLLKASPDGSAISYFISGGGAAAAGEGGQDFPSYEARRGGSGWNTHGFLPPSNLGENALVLAWSEDLRRDYALVWRSGEKATLYLRDNEQGTHEVIATGLDTFGGTSVAAESQDGSAVLFESTTKLAPQAVAGIWNLYLWRRGSGSVDLVSVLPGGGAAPTGSFAGAYAWSQDDLQNGGARAHDYTQTLHSLSADGSQAVFTTAGDGQLYVRKGLGGLTPSTVRASASRKSNGSGPGGSDPNGPQPAQFMQATPDGRYVFFTSSEELTNDADTGSADQGKDLYRYDTANGDLIDLAPDAGDPDGAEVGGVLGTSQDGSYVYFVANGALAPGATVAPQTDTNLYLWHEGSVTFVAQLRAGEEQDEPNWIPTAYRAHVMPLRRSRVTPDGTTLLFSSRNSPTSYDSKGLNEFYRFRVGEGVQCVSCNPNELPARVAASEQTIDSGFTKPIPPEVPWLLHNLSDDGNRAFFESREKLVAADHDNTQDVYEWEADGTGSCHGNGQDGGCLFLISTGTSADPSYFADASASGDDVFFFTTDRLVGQDVDALQDVYDARVGGGLASQNPPPANPCSGEACRGPATLAPEGAAPGTANISGPGNLPAKPQKKPHRHKKHHKPKHRKHHRKGQGKKHHKANDKTRGNRQERRAAR